LQNNSWKRILVRFWIWSKRFLYFRIDRKKKLPITTFLFALGFSKEKIIETFYSTSKYSYNSENKSWVTDFNLDNYKRPLKLSYDLIDAKNNKKVLGKGEKLNIVIAKKLKEKGLNSISIPNEQITGKYIGKDIKDKNIQNSNNEWGKGGISTKLISAEIATKGGVEVQLVDGTNKKNLIEIFNNNKIGTLFYPVDKPIGNKKSWLSHAIQTVGKITLDDGASFAIKKKGASLLAVGVKNVEGNFTVNQAVNIVNTNDKEVAKGLVSISSDKFRSILNNKENNNSSIIVVHRDVLALS